MKEFLNLFRIPGSRLSVLFLAMMFSFLIACGGGGSSSSDGGDTGGTGGDEPVEEITIPAPGESGTIALSSGTNVHGIQRLWRGTVLTENILSASRGHYEAGNGDGTVYVYFGDNAVLFFYNFGDAWYAISEEYTFNTDDNTYITTSGYRIYKGKVVISGDTAQLLNLTRDGHDLYKLAAADTFEQTVTTWAEFDEDIDPTLVMPEINTLQATCTNGTLSIEYNITPPAGKTIQWIEFRVISPVLVEKLGISEAFKEMDVPVSGQMKYAGGSSSASGTLPTDMTNAENGDWVVRTIWIQYTDGTNGSLTLQQGGQLRDTYFYNVYDEAEDEEKMRDTEITGVTFTVSSATPDTTAPVMTDISIDGTTLTVTTSDDSGSSCRIAYVGDNLDANDNWEWNWIYGTEVGDTFEFDLSSVTSGSYYVFAIDVSDGAGNHSLYYGYDTDITCWASTFADWDAFGVDLTYYNLYKGNELPEATSMSLITFTRP